MREIRVIDSHTAGEPTRVVIAGGPDLGPGSLGERLARLRTLHDRFRSAVVNEPRGSDVLVGALLCEPADPSCSVGVIFFNNVGYLGMCGHGTIGVVATLAHLGRIQPGSVRLETPVGPVRATLHEDHSVSVENVPSFRKTDGFVSFDVPGMTDIGGQIAWGGNWFVLVEDQELPLDLDHVEQLTDRAWRIRQAVNAQGFPQVDHVELYGPAQSDGADGRSFVLCPGKAYDRSPCGTGLSAKLACMAVDEWLEEGAPWVQESVIGSRFVGSFRWLDRQAGTIVPTITGRAFITAEATLLIDPHDPLAWGLRD